MQMVSDKTLRIFTAAAAVVFAMAPLAKTGAEEACPLRQEKFAAIKEIQNNPDLDYLSGIREELRLRKSLLHETTDCATEELLALKKSFDSIKGANEETRVLQRQFAPWFSEVLNYYALQKSQIDGLGLQGSKDFAKNFLAWREGNFQPTAKLISQFIVWSRNQELLEVGKNRLNQIRRAIDVFGLNFNEEIRSGLNASEAEFQKTSAYNQRAKEIIKGYGDAEDAAQAIKAFFGSLTKTYENLLALAEKINKAIVK